VLGSRANRKSILLLVTEELLPTWIDGGTYPFFGVPGNRWRGFKIADDTRGPVIDPSTMEREISEERLTATRAYLRMRFPAIAGSRYLRAGFAGMKTPQTTILFWIAIPKRRTSGLLAEARGTVSNMDR
jgi:hypothetical protein